MSNGWEAMAFPVRALRRWDSVQPPIFIYQLGAAMQGHYLCKKDTPTPVPSKTNGRGAPFFLRQAPGGVFSSSAPLGARVGEI
jgi:hypothetical protein